MENQALEIIDMLYALIAEAWGVPLGSEKCIIERDKALSLLDDLKRQLPVELSEAKRLVNARDEFVGSAKKEAESIRRMAEEQAHKMVDSQEVTRVARQQANETVQTAEEKSRELRRAASEFLDDAMRRTEDSIAAALDQIRQARSQFRTVAAPAPESGAKAGVTLEDVEGIDSLDE